MTAWLARHGFDGISKHTFDRLMRQESMRRLIRGRKTTSMKAKNGGKRATDLLNRQFRTISPNRPWVTDFSVPAWRGFVYVAFAIKLFSRAIVGWSVWAVKDVAFVEACRAMALWRAAITLAGRHSKG